LKKKRDLQKKASTLLSDKKRKETLPDAGNRKESRSETPGVDLGNCILKKHGEAPEGLFALVTRVVSFVAPSVRSKSLVQKKLSEVEKKKSRGRKGKFKKTRCPAFVEMCRCDGNKTQLSQKNKHGRTGWGIAPSGPKRKTGGREIEGSANSTREK